MGFRLFGYLIKRKRTILISAVVFAVAGLLYVLIADPAYESRAMLMPPMEEGSEGLLTAWMASMSLPSMIAPMTSGSMSAAIMVDILGSRGLAENVVSSLGLMKWYRVDTMDDAVKKLRGSVSASSSQVGIITLKVRDRDPRMAMDIARHHIAGLDSINKKLLYERAEGTVEFTRKQIEMYRRRLEESRIRIAEFQEEHGVFNFDEQIRGAVDVASALEIRAAITAVQIDIMREFSRDEAIELHKKEIELRNINRQIENFMRGDTSRTVFLSLEKVPSLQQKYAALQRDLEVNERVYSFLLQRHEESGIDLARTTASVQVVDSPKIPEKRAGIPRWAVVLIAFAVGGAWMTLVLLWWGWTSMKERTGEEDEAFRSVIDQLSGDMAELRRRLRI